MPRQPEEAERGSTLPWILLPPTAVWLVMTVLRESALFWRNAGGYPVELRELVLYTYYPFTALLLAVSLLGAFRTFVGATTLRRITALGWLILAMSLGFGLAYAGANNLANLLDGRPLHSHRSPALPE